MGNTTLLYAAVAFVIAIISLLLGFSWGRSKVKSGVEDALEKQRVSLSTREFGMRQQLEEAFAEIARLRPLAEELGRVKAGPKHERMNAEPSSAVRVAAVEAPADRERASASQKSALTPESTDLAVKKLLQSLEKFNRPVESSSAGAESPATREQQREPKLPQQATVTPRPPQRIQNPVPKPVLNPVQNPVLKEPVRPQTFEKKRSVPPSPGPRPQVIDEWQEFARSLDALTNRKK